MKLKINVVDFEKCEISFIVPREVMDNRAWGAGQAEVDIFAVSQTLEERAAGKPIVPGQHAANNARDEICPITAMQCMSGRVQVVCVRQGISCPHAGQTSPVA